MLHVFLMVRQQRMRLSIRIMTWFY
ncbi:MAG: hypothetical protein K0Q56_1336, partial [Sporolactobacillus laevolacticus]|nr:hypothetical protein [Sporolactobacillus laevolacticus]